ncbi:hypothetical protein SMI01S_08000 [Sphingobacterium mizutaii NBRC 14946 = DSM 11724]|uniref:DUF4783 domain-containing protein n=3 Tax=Sphingobacteriaceae TaxID=84566 RepID=A0AAJ4XC94_9SPHI|nr:DUF4783 domain-containing protein [Sphingobacterium mizutaii]GEM67194.1 hypothetical protein SMI01S_08000 [Sphingobacterium mizutaii NBRC 14946 = DSM 11724]SDK98537.1 protein of unknown function [Sphingobacterium mizutaii]SNV49450.1 Uncharacterised protein [Sphingobacterium mizutaii]
MLGMWNGYWKKIRQIALAMLLLPFLLLTSFQSDVALELLGALKANNAKNVANFFGQNVSLSIKNDSGYYSKFQAEVILSDFFRLTKTSEVKQVQRTNSSNNSFYIVYQIKTNQGSYRVFVKLVQSGGDAQINELRIE